MPSVTDILSLLLKNSVAMNTYECSCCEKGVCNVPGMHGPNSLSAQHEQFKRSFPDADPAEMPEPEPCWNCSGTLVPGQCTSCNGTGVVSAHPCSSKVYETTMPAAILTIAQLRGRSDFARANVALEWVIDYNARSLAYATDGIDTEEAMRKSIEVLKAGNELLSAPADVSPCSSALSEAELAELGIDVPRSTGG